MQYTELQNIKNFMSGMVLNNLPSEKKLKSYGLLDFAEKVFINLNKHRSVEHGIPLTASGSFDGMKFLAQKEEEFKKSLTKEGKLVATEDLTEEEVILNEANKLANEFCIKLWQQLEEENYTELIEPVPAKLLNFLSDTEFSVITRPRKIARQDATGKTENIDWFLTADQERLLYRYLVEPEKKKKNLL